MTKQAPLGLRLCHSLAVSDGHWSTTSIDIAAGRAGMTGGGGVCSRYRLPHTPCSPIVRTAQASSLASNKEPVYYECTDTHIFICAAAKLKLI